MRQLNSLGQAVPVESSSASVTFKNLKNDQHQTAYGKAKKQPKDENRDDVEELRSNADEDFVERRSGDERRKDGHKARKRWIESRQQPDRRKNNQQPKISFVI